jgi:CBS domain-containing protein
MKHHRSQVRDWMTADPVTVSLKTALFEAYNVMFDNEIRRLPVIQGNDLVGIITLSDVQRSIPPHTEAADMEIKLELMPATVEDVMTYDPVTITPEDTIREAAARMLEYQVSGLPVVQNGEIVGIITESDIFKLIVEGWSDEGVASETVRP